MRCSWFFECSPELEEEVLAGSLEYRGTAGDVIDKVRAECRLFHKSPALNDELRAREARQGHVKLVLDVRTRWSSTLHLLRNFLHEEDALREFYASNGREFSLQNAELSHLKEIVSALGHVDEATRRLSLKEKTLKGADFVLQVGVLFV